MTDNRLLPIEFIRGDSAEDTALLSRMVETARNYIQTFDWCPTIDEMYFGDGVGGVVAVFLVTFRSKIAGTDDRLWVVVGDVPSAYMVVESEETPLEALGKYCDLMDEWAVAVQRRRGLDDVFPVSAPPTSENAFLLQQRLRFLRREIVDRGALHSKAPFTDSSPK